MNSTQESWNAWIGTALQNLYKFDDHSSSHEIYWPSNQTATYFVNKTHYVIKLCLHD